MYHYKTGFIRIRWTGKKHSHGTPAQRFARKSAIFPFIVAILLVLFPFSSQAAMRGVTISYLPDPGPNLSIEAAASAEEAGKYTPYVPSFLAFSRLPDSFNGAVWLRMVFAPSFNVPEGATRVSFGSDLPGTTRLFIPQPDGSFSVKSSLPPRALFILPGNRPFPDALYARIDGAPSLWFRPVVEAAEETPHDIPLHLILAGVLTFAMLITVAQYIRKAEEWRLWAAITIGCGIVAALAPPLPAAGKAFVPLAAATLLMPGLILVFFSHMTRHLLTTPKTLPGYDRLLVFYYLLGGALALLPLVPGFLWTTRYLPFIGLALLPLLPLGMIAIARALRGAGAFFCATLLPIAGVAVSAWELTAPGTPVLSSTGGLWGLALGMILLGLIRPARAREDVRSDDDVFASLDRACPFPGKQPETPFISPSPDEAAPPSPFAAPSPENAYPELSLFADKTGETLSREQGRPEYPDLAIFDDTADKTPDGGEYPEINLFEKTEEEQLSEPQAPFMPAPQQTSAEQREESPPPVNAALKTPVTEMPEPEPMAMAVPESAPEPPLQTGAAITIEDETPLPAMDETPVAEESPVHAGAEDLERKSLFDLPLLVKEAYDSIAPLAEQKNIGLTWFIAPQTGRLFEGEAELLKSSLCLLLRDMAKAVDRGNVRLTARRLPDSNEAGHLVFTIVEWDGKPAASARNLAGLAEAWALAEKTGGIFSVEHSPNGGTTVIFSAVFSAMDKPKTAHEDDTATPAPEEPGETAAGAPAFVEAKSKEQVQIFTDHSDIATPADFEPAAQLSVPAGLDGGELIRENDGERLASRIIIVDITTSGRSRTAAMFAETPYAVLECASPAAVAALYARHPSGLLIMNADIPEADIISAIQAIRAEDAAKGRPPVPLITFVEHEMQAERMAKGGSDMTLMKPVTREALLEAVGMLLPLTTPSVTAPAADPAKEENASHAPKPVAVTIPDAPAENPEPEWSIESSGIFATALPPDTSSEEQDAIKRFSGPELALLDMIVTDEETEPVREKPVKHAPKITVTAAPAKKPAPKTAKVEVVALSAKSPAKKQADTEQPAETKPHGGKTEAGVAVGAPVPKAVPKQKPAPESKVEPAPRPAPETKTNSTRAEKIETKLEHAPETKIDLASFSPEKSTDDSSSQPAPNALMAALQPDDGAGFHSAPSTSPQAAEISIPLPGEEDSVFKDMLPLVPGLIHELSDAMQDAAKGREKKSPILVQGAAERIAGKAESFGLTKLERMARCVERAAAADDIEPMECVLADLENWVARYKEALQKLHRGMHW